MNPQITLDVKEFDNIYLRLISHDDDLEFYANITAEIAVSDSNIATFQYWTTGFNPKSVKAETERSLNEIKKDKMLRYRIVRVHNDAESIIGEVSLFEHDANLHVAQHGYMIIAAFEGKGITKACAQRLLDYGVELWSLQQVILEIEVGNEPSQELAKALGAQLTDRTRDDVTKDGLRHLRIWEIKI